MAKVLIVEDNLELCENLSKLLVAENISVETVHRGDDALQLISAFEFDLIVLDWDLPATTGLDICKKYRAKDGATTIMFLTGHATEVDKLAGFDSGADDYLTKPFLSSEFVARVKALLRRRRSSESTELKVDNIELVVKRRTLIIGNKEFHLAPKECALLEFLMRNKNTAYNAEALLNAVWPSDSDGSTGSVRTWMRILRQKFEATGHPDFIKTLPHSGYIIEG